MRGFLGGHSPPFSPRIDALFLPEPREKEHVLFVFVNSVSVEPPALSSSSSRSHGRRLLLEEDLVAGAWFGTEICEGHIEALRLHRLLPPASQVLVRIPGAETAPTRAAGEIVVFDEPFYKGFGLPASSFFYEWLHFFGLQPHHLAPNAIFQLVAFMVLCEGFLGIEPRLDLRRSLFFHQASKSLRWTRLRWRSMSATCNDVVRKPHWCIIA
ncbi:hypothetical protein D1007_35908 [Hordeum vulgare]|nr:hypothetical protein D1007_35908 [Hordeum vulgare]